MDIVTRQEVGYAPPTKPFVAQGIVANFFLHHSVTPDIGDELEELRRIDRDHKADGSRAIDYGFAMGRDWTIYEGRGWFVADGATATGWGPVPDGNYYGREVTLVLLGNYQDRLLSDKGVDRIREFIAMAVDLGALTKTHTTRGHRDVRATACPGDHAYDRLDDIRVPWVGEEEDTMDQLYNRDCRQGYAEMRNILSAEPDDGVAKARETLNNVVNETDADKQDNQIGRRFAARAWLEEHGALGTP